MNKKYLAVLVIALLIGAGILFFFLRFYNNDINALAGFSVAYEKYDRAIADFSGPLVAASLAGPSVLDDLERKAGQALADLKTKASVRISSLIKNDAELMSTSLEIADLSAKELDALKAYRTAVAAKTADLDQAARAFAEGSHQRQAAYVHFLDLAGLNN